MYIHVSTFKCVLISLLEIKCLVSLKNESVFLDQDTFQGRKSSSPKFRGELLIKWGSDRFIIFLGGLGKKGLGQYFKGADTLKDIWHKVMPSIHQINKPRHWHTGLVFSRDSLWSCVSLVLVATPLMMLSQ